MNKKIEETSRKLSRKKNIDENSDQDEILIKMQYASKNLPVVKLKKRIIKVKCFLLAPYVKLACENG